MEDKLQKFLGKEVVIDTSTSYLYIGTLTEFGKEYFLLREVDVHDTSQGTSTKERYILDSKKYTLKTNRKEVLVFREKVVSISLFEDVLTF
ncbi:MAG: hypothetical protein D6785_16285 [Planctomycetota bacterium]|nr:MAG: hypothetical protein D6785_16285 [Planctomycetota bacterium]